jgi:5-hydroxyisourate hydrolase
MGQLTTHVLDTAAGVPAAGVRIELRELSSPEPTLLLSTMTGKDGRCAAPLLSGPDFHTGRYLMTFFVGDYFRARGIRLPEPAFIEEALIQVGIAAADQHYHVPLLVSPWTYSVYRGG